VEPTHGRPLLPQLRLDELLAELQVRLAAVVKTRDRVHALLDAVVAIGSNDVTVEAGQELILLVRDNGTGIKETGCRSGLANLADRAGLLGGSMCIEPADGGGTELEWRMIPPAWWGCRG
jgi:nitrate/nitrite-specific signal transduction histidine kinase